MSRKSRYSYEDKLKACEDYFSGKRSMLQIANDFESSEVSGAMWRWIYLYRIHGASALLPKLKNSSYTKKFKLEIVEQYIDGTESVEYLASKYNLNPNVLHKWILLYNSDMELKDYNPIQEVYMAEARRKTTLEERIAIVEYCMEHNCNYKMTAQKYEVSYSQVYSWVRKFNNGGNGSLTDNRGQHKSETEVDELEKLRRENKRLKRQLEEKDMTVELLKKVKEFGRRRF